MKEYNVRLFLLLIGGGEVNNVLLLLFIFGMDEVKINVHQDIFIIYEDLF